MGILIGLIGIIFGGVYCAVSYYRFESEVDREQSVREESIKKVLLHTHIGGIILGISPTLVFIPTPYWGLYLISLIFWIGLPVWGLTVSTRSGIKRLEIKYGKV